LPHTKLIKARAALVKRAELLQNDPGVVTASPTVCQLHIDLARLIHVQGQGIAGVTEWRPNDIAAMRCRAGSLGITPHRDSKRCDHVIAIFTIEGCASFTLCGNREATIVDR